MSTATLSNLMFMQFALEALLVIMIFILIRRTRRVEKSNPAQMPENLKNSIEKFLTDSEKIAKVFAENLKDKKELSADLILKLDRRLSDYQKLLKQTEANFNASRKKMAELEKNAQLTRPPSSAPPLAIAEPGKANPAAPEVRAQVLKMARNGHSADEIASKVHLHLGEVELIIDLERQFSV